MFNRPHHQKIAKILNAFDADVLTDAECFFAGGTAIALEINEYRESVDIDFLCASQDGYRKLKNIVSNNFGSLLKTPLKHLRRDVQTDQYEIFTYLEMDGVPVKVELVKEYRIAISGKMKPGLNVLMLKRCH